MRLFSLEGKLFALLTGTVLVATVLTIGFAYFIHSMWLAWLLAITLTIPLIVFTARWSARPVAHLLRALSGSVLSFRDGDFSFSINSNRRDEFGDLARAHNELGHVLREERQNLFQRELLLDTVVQYTPTCLVLVDKADHVIYANLAARQLLNGGQRLQGLNFSQVVSECPAPLAQAVADGEDGLFTVAMEQEDEIFHLSKRSFRLHGREHRLFLIKRLTRELSRQEVQTWKKVIRIISHELNNSLAPISSLAHSGREWVAKNDLTRMMQIFDTISERTQHLDGFIRGYAEFAKLPQPRLESVAWRPFLDGLAQHYPFREFRFDAPAQGWFDRAQIEQVLINLLKNAHESGGAAAAVELGVDRLGEDMRIEVRDRGAGMSEQVLTNALLPFYSTKRSGTGLGLALAREIVEAHNGRITLANREGGGVCVSFILPGRRLS